MAGSSAAILDHAVTSGISQTQWSNKAEESGLPDMGYHNSPGLTLWDFTNIKRNILVPHEFKIIWGLSVIS